MLALVPTFGKILITVVVILIAGLVIRARIQRGRRVAATWPPGIQVPLIPAGALHALADVGPLELEELPARAE